MTDARPPVESPVFSECLNYRGLRIFLLVQTDSRMISVASEITPFRIGYIFVFYGNQVSLLVTPPPIADETERYNNRCVGMDLRDRRVFHREIQDELAVVTVSCLVHI